MGVRRFFQAWFEGYTSEMRRLVPPNDEDTLDEFDMKVEHTYKVRDEAEDIARWLGLEGRYFETASLCGLFHDLGRFEQAVRFGSMDDKITGSHADWSEYVFNEKVPKDLLTVEERELIASALRYHNLFALPDGLDEKTLRYAQLTRDADKLDIFRHVLALREEKEKRKFRFVQYETEGDLRTELFEAVMRGENLNSSCVKTRTDRLLLEISLVFDLCFGISFQKTLDMRFVERRLRVDPLEKEKASYDERLLWLTESVLAYMRERTGYL